MEARLLLNSIRLSRNRFWACKGNGGEGTERSQPHGFLRIAVTQGATFESLRGETQRGETQREEIHPRIIDSDDER